MKRLTYFLIFILIGLNLSSCFGEDLSDEYYNPILKNETDKKIILKLIHNTEKEPSILLDNIYISAQKDTIWGRFFGNNLESNIQRDIDNTYGSKIEIYVDEILVKVWEGPHGDYGENNSPYNYNYWKVTTFKNPIITGGEDRILGNYVFTITDKDLE